MLRRLGPRRDGGAGLAEYAGLVVLAALILGALVALGLPSKVETGVSSAICRIFQGQDCGKPEAAGKTPGNQSPGAQSPGGQPTNPGPTNGNQNPNGQKPNGNQPSLSDLQKNADKAQKAANDTSGKYGNIKQEIIDLLKDFIGITDIEDCISKGSISSCLWAAFDVASWVFAALKIAKFAKAVKDAIKLWKEYNKGRKLIEKAKDAARRAKELLKKRRKACGVSYTFSNDPPWRAVYASIPKYDPPDGYSGTVFRDGSYRFQIYSNDHGPAHGHLLGPGIKGDGIQIGQNGKPLDPDVHLSRAQQRVIDDHIGEIRKAIRKSMAAHRNSQKGNCE